MPKPIDLKGASVAITGAARGIGYATARAFVAEGARVFIGDLDADLAKASAKELGCAGAGVDVRSRKSFADFLAGIDAPLEVLVNNAGIMPAGRFVDEPDAVTDAIVNVNLNGVLRGTKLVLPGMLERGSGHIVNVASYLGEVPAAGLATYCASKHAVVGFSEALRDELADTGVTVTTVLPSAVRTDLVSGSSSAGCCRPSTLRTSPRPSSRPARAGPPWSRSRAGCAVTRPSRPWYPTRWSEPSVGGSPATGCCAPSTRPHEPATTSESGATPSPGSRRNPEPPVTAARLLSVNVTADLHEGAAWTGAQGRSGIDKRPYDGPRLLAGDAVQGDSVINRKHHGGPWQAVYAYAREDADWWQTRLCIDIPPGSFGENLTTAGLDLTNAVIGETWRIGSATLRVTVPRIPCRTFAGFWGRSDLVKLFTSARRPGAYLRIVDEGEVRAGDAIEVVERPTDSATLAQAFACRTGDRSLLESLRHTKDLPPDWQTWLDSATSR